MRSLGLAGQKANGLTDRHRPAGPKGLPRTVRTNNLWERQHLLIRHPRGTACIRCGRTTVANRQGRLQQWRRDCTPLTIHTTRLARRHKVTWAGQWGCTHCPLTGNRLSRHGCFATHPTGRKRYPSKKRPIGNPGDLWRDPNTGTKRSLTVLPQEPNASGLNRLHLQGQVPGSAKRARGSRAPRAAHNPSGSSLGLHRFWRQVPKDQQQFCVGGASAAPHLRTRVRPPGHLVSGPAKRPRSG